MFSRNEKGLLIAFAVILVAIGGAYLLSQHLEKVASERIAEEKKGLDHTYAVGETAVLDSAREHETATEDGSYDVWFGWEGEMRAQVDSAQLLTTAEEVDRVLPEQQYRYEFRFDPAESNVVAVKLSLENVSATPTMTTQSGKEWFNISHFGITMGAIGYFNGTPQVDDLRSSEGYWFDLPAGSSATYTLAYIVPKDADPADLFMYVGSWDQRFKHRFDLGLA